MTEIIGKGWRELYEKYSKMFEQCSNKGHIPIIMSQYSGEYIGQAGNYQVFLRCGWEEDVELKGRLTGTIGGLTKRQVKFLNRVEPDNTAIKAVGPTWPGLNEAIKRAERAGAEYS